MQLVVPVDDDVPPPVDVPVLEEAPPPPDDVPVQVIEIVADSGPSTPPDVTSETWRLCVVPGATVAPLNV